MAENPKYPESELTDEDKKQLDEVIVKIVAFFHSHRKRYPNPKTGLAEKVFLKLLDSNADIGVLLTRVYAKTDQPANVFQPGQLNRRTANDRRHFLLMESDESNFLHPRDLSERVLKKNVDTHILNHLEGKKNIRFHESKIKKQRTKAPINENRQDRGGRPSAYMISDEVMRIRNLAEKNGAWQYIRERMIAYGIGYDLVKYVIEAIVHVAKMDKRFLLLY